MVRKTFGEKFDNDHSSLGAQGDPNKWNMSGWKFEPYYKDLTLTGNWFENRRNFQRTHYDHTSTHRADFVPYPEHKPNKIDRRQNAIIQRDGLHEKHFTRHHGDRWDDMKITIYDQEYNGRVRTGANKLPPLRSYNFTHCEMRPQPIDHPVEGAPTNFGLYTKKLGYWDYESNIWKKHVKRSRYDEIYKPPPPDAYPERYGVAPRSLSSRFQTITTVNKNLSLRNAPYLTAPERPPTLQQPSPSYPIVPPQAIGETVYKKEVEAGGK